MNGLYSINQRQFSLTVAGITLLLLSGCSDGGNGEQAAGFTQPPTPVEAAIVQQQAVREEFEAVGTVQALNAIDVVSQVDALVVQLPFREGQYIGMGGLIAKLDDTQLRAEEQRAIAIRDQRNVAHSRIQALVEKGHSSAAELDDAVALLKVAEADLAVIQARLAKTRITAPFSGVLGARKVSPGAFVRAGDVITNLSQLDELKVTFTAPERYYPSLQRGALVTVTTTAFPGQSFDGPIDVIEPVITQTTRSANVIARIKNPERKLHPGMSANVSVVLSAKADALIVPDEAVFVEGNQAFVYLILPDSTVKRAPVDLGMRRREAVEILKGLDAGAMVLKAGHQKIFMEGTKVMPIMSQPTEAPQAMAQPAEQQPQ